MLLDHADKLTSIFRWHPIVRFDFLTASNLGFELFQLYWIVLMSFVCWCRVDHRNVTVHAFLLLSYLCATKMVKSDGTILRRILLSVFIDARDLKLPELVGRRFDD